MGIKFSARANRAPRVDVNKWIMRSSVAEETISHSVIVRSDFELLLALLLFKVMA